MKVHLLTQCWWKRNSFGMPRILLYICLVWSSFYHPFSEEVFFLFTVTFFSGQPQLFLIGVLMGTKNMFFHKVHIINHNINYRYSWCSQDQLELWFQETNTQLKWLKWKSWILLDHAVPFREEKREMGLRNGYVWELEILVCLSRVSFLPLLMWLHSVRSASLHNTDHGCGHL